MGVSSKRFRRPSGIQRATAKRAGKQIRPNTTSAAKGRRRRAKDSEAMGAKDTPVGEDRLDWLDTRVTALEQWMEDFKLQMNDVGNEVKANTALTEEIHGDTKDIIEAVRWMSTTRKYLVHGCAVVAAVAGVAKALGLF